MTTRRGYRIHLPQTKQAPKLDEGSNVELRIRSGQPPFSYLVVALKSKVGCSVKRGMDGVEYKKYPDADDRAVPMGWMTSMIGVSGRHKGVSPLNLVVDVVLEGRCLGLSTAPRFSGLV